MGGINGEVLIIRLGDIKTEKESRWGNYKNKT